MIASLRILFQKDIKECIIDESIIFYLPLEVDIASHQNQTFSIIFKTVQALGIIASAFIPLVILEF